jgi:hypothetical protein
MTNTKNPITIETNVPLPTDNYRRGSTGNKYPIASMNPGDSFFVPYNSGDAKKRNSLASSLRQSARRFTDKGQQYATRRFEDGVRLWRLS